MLVLDIGTKARLQRIADHYGYRSITAMLEQWSMQTASAIDDETESKAKARNYPAHPETN
jgi:hypothetical protein